MIPNRLKPTNDFIFKKIFGENEVKENLISLLNAILKLEGDRRLKDITIIDNKELVKELITDKTGRLDVRAETMENTQIDIEIQLIDQKNIVERMLYYLSKMYSESIKSGGKYKDLKKTIVIGILDFDYFHISKFHSTYHFYEDEIKDFMLTDKFELNFVEMPKFRSAFKDINNPLHRWLLFLENDIPKEMLKEVVEMDPVIRKAEERLEWLSSDEETIKLYKAREEALIEKMSLIGEVEDRTKREIAKNLLDILDIETIADKTGLTIEEIEQMKKSLN
ncbi:MAG: Rpn family recombination-promoting nuclease/putative transposase [Bacillota bacterium]|nr:Rpn family recombination-promoting nuclease/putative transposase [Bacillota bacterium]